MSEWNSNMGEAPKDGTEILVAFRQWRPADPGKEVYVTAARWEWSPDARDDHALYPDDGAFLEINNDWSDQWGGNLGPTHWMHFPPPPTGDPL